MSKLRLRNVPHHNLPKIWSFASSNSLTVAFSIFGFNKCWSSIYHEPKRWHNLFHVILKMISQARCDSNSYDKGKFKCKLRRMSCLGFVLGASGSMGWDSAFSGSGTIHCAIFLLFLGKIFLIMSLSRFPSLSWSFYLCLEDLLNENIWEENHFDHHLGTYMLSVSTFTIAA